MRSIPLSSAARDAAWRRTVLSVQLLIERRTTLYLAADGIILFGVLVGVLAGGEVQSFYSAVLLPFLIVGVPALSDAVALERRAGSLDLALSSPGGNVYFERRFVALLAVMVLQGWLVLVTVRLTIAPFTLVPAMIQTVVSGVLVVAAVLFWAVRLRGPGAVTFASLLTVAVLGRWFFASPILRPGEIAADLLEWGKANLVMAGAAVVLYLYARRRLIRPETML